MEQLPECQCQKDSCPAIFHTYVHSVKINTAELVLNLAFCPDI